MKKLNNLKSSLQVGMLFYALLFIAFPIKAENPELNALQMSCISWLQVSLSANGEAVLTPQMLLSNPQPNYGIFDVNIVDPPIGGNIADCSHVDETISVKVTNTVTNNSCWSMVLIEDKSAPVIECSEKEIDCWQPLDFADPDYFLDTLYDNCTETEELDLWFSQNIQTLNCDPNYELVINRTWTVTDKSGNSSSCEQTINVLRGDINQVFFPADTLLNCPFTDIDPDVLGYPTLNGNEITPSCGILIGYTDTNPIPLCNGGQSYKFFRTWTAMDWCAMIITTSTQTIEVKDTIPPGLICPDDITIFTGIQTCNATYIFPNIDVEDACSDPNEIDIRFRVNGALNFDPLTVLPIGENTIEVQAIDPCLNMSTCEYTVTVEDNVPPILLCQNLVISLTNDEPLRVPVEVITSGFTFTDNCGIGEVEIRRMEDLCDSQEDLDFGDSIAFCCEDVEQSVSVEVKVTDVNGNGNFCMFEITIQDKVPPVIISCAPDSAITCDQLSLDFSRFGEPEAIGLCDLIFDFEVSVEIDSCWEGNVFITHFVFNTGGIGDSCVQTLSVTNPFDFSEDNIIWPVDTLIVSCPSSIDPNEINSHPEVTADACNGIIQFGFSDSIATDNDFCSTIYRTWISEQSCYPGLQFTHIQRIDLLNPGELEITRQVLSATTVSCFEEALDPSLPVVEDACGRILTPVSSSVFDDPSGADCEGVRVYTYTYEDCNGNTLDWTFTYTIEYEGFSVPENEVMVVSCPDDTDNQPEPPLVNDSCGNPIQPSSPEVTEKPECEGERIYTWTFTDCAGNSNNWIFTYIIEFENFEIGVSNVIDTIECSLEIKTPTPPVVFDNCGNELEGVLVQTPEIPECEGEAEYIFQYEDCAGNIQFWSYTFLVQYQPFETISDFDFPIMCIGEIGMPEPPEVFDNCFIELEPIGDPEISEFPECEGMVTFTWTFEDCAGNQNQFTGTYIIEITDPPTEIGGPVETLAIVNCVDQATNPINLPVVEDACGNVLVAPEPAITDDPDPVTCEGTRSYIYTYEDCAGNEFIWEFIYIIEYEDFELPVNGQATVACPDDTDVVPPPPVVLDACDNPLTPMGPVVSEKPECEGQRTYTWTYIDCAENSKEWSFVYTIELNEGPILPANQTDTIPCPDSLYVIPFPTDIVDQCGRSVEAGEPQVESMTENNLQIITYTYEYEDCAGNIAEWVFTLVIDIEDLEIGCPENIEVSNDPGLCEADITIDPAVVTGGCGIDSLFNSYNFTEDASDIYPVGETEVIFTVVDITGITATCTFTVTVNDEEAPIIDCPADVTVSTDEGQCFTTEVELGEAEFSDNCPGIVLEVSIPDTFELGVTIITYTVTDASGNTAECEQTVTVEDNEDPTIECPEELVVSNDAGECFATDVEFDPAAVADNCGIDTVIILAPDTFLLGTTTIVYIVTDINGNTAECETSVTVIDGELPILECPDEIIVEVDLGECEAEVTVVITATDNCSDSLLITNSFNDGGADASGVYPLGETIVVFTVEDESGNVASCSVTVIVEGDDALEIECPENVEVSNDPGLCEADIMIDSAVVTGGCGIDSLFNSYNFTEDASDIYPVGETFVTFTVVDLTGATATCIFTVTVNDEEAPIIDCPANVTASTDEGECFATEVDLGTPEFSDNCPGVMLEVSIPDTFEVGLTVIVYTAIDSSGNSSSCSQMVTVEDDEDPSISCPEELVVSNDVGECFATDIEFDAAVVSDNCGVDTVIITAPDTFFLGSNTIIYTVIDVNGNSAICEASVRVIDDELPELVCPDEIVVEVEPMECEAEVMLMITATDNCTDLLTITNSFNNGGADASGIYPLGETIVVFTVEDEAGNVDSCSVTVIVEGDEPLEIDCPENIIQTNDPDSCEASIAIPPATVTGGCGIESITNDFNFTEDASGIYSVGETVVEFTVVDSFGASATCTFIVIVEDNEDPIIVCPEDIVQENDPGECGADIEVTVVSFSDNCGIDTIFNDFSETIAADGFYSVDTTVVTYTVIDVNGNSAECSFTVVIFDNEIPMLTCPDDVVIEVDPGECEALVTGLIASATDNCTDSLVIVNSFNDGGADASDLYPLGETIVVFTVTDEAGNIDSCSVTVLIEGDEPLEVICPEDIMVDNDSEECFAFVSIDSAMVTGGCGLDSLFNDFNFTADASDFYNVGITVVTFTAIDEVGAIAICSFTVTVNDTEAPTIECPEDITVSADDGECFATDFDLGDAEANDNCPGVIIDVIIPDTFELGTTSIIYIAIDSSGNTAECEQTITVEDNEDPTINCPEDIVQVNDPGECGAFLDIDIPDFSDNCPGASITNDFTNVDDASALYPVDTTVVTYTVVDASGNSAGCSFTVIILDDEAPVFIACPDNEVLPCSEYEEGIDISQFGEPEVNDNCPVGLQVIETFEIDIDSCTSTGTITRMFTVFDSAGNSDSSCTQVITFEGVTSLDSSDFIWPNDFILITDCSIFNPDSIPGGEPILNPDVETCNEVSIVMEDEMIMVDTACDIIIRTWTVTDLCNPLTGEWVFIQTITVEDTIAPEFTVAPIDTLTAFADSISCDAFVEIMVEAIDDCGGDVIITNNSPFADSSGADASGVYPIGLTTFEFEAVDNCGNVTILEVNVLVVDTIPPVINCFKFRYIIDDNLSAVAVDTDFLTELSDNCIDSIDIEITFDLSDFDLDTLFFNFTNCDSIPGLFPITIYAIDASGNIDSCETQIAFEDPMGFCPDSLVGNINGLVYHHDMDRMVEGVELNVESPFFNDQINTDYFGLFEFLHVPQLSNMQLRPFKDDDPLNGVTTFDIYLLQRHILGINVITDPYYLIAADVNNDGLINVIDVLELRRLILGSSDQFPNNTSWRFLDKNFIIPHGVMPTQIDLPETVDIYFSTDRFFQQDFVGVKIGDLNGNVATTDLRSESRQRTSYEGIYVEDRLVNAGEIVTVEFHLRNGIEFNGIQFDLRWDNIALDIEDINWADQLEITDNSYLINFDGLETSIRLSQSSPSLLKPGDNGQLFSLTFIANQSGKLSEWIRFEESSIPTEIFSGFSDYNILELRFNEVFVSENDDLKSFQLFQNRPNPFTGITSIPFITDEDGRASLVIYDVRGKQLAVLSDEFTEGYHHWEINARALGLSNGVYYYKLQVGNHQAVRKMIVK